MKVFNINCHFAQYVNEWAIPIEDTFQATVELKELIEKNNIKAHFPIEIRFVKGDDIYLSPSYGRDTCYIGIIIYKPYGMIIEYEE
jgi:L-gulonolactone oxidase